MADHDLLFMFDVDNTLIDNDQVLDDWRAHLLAAVGQQASDLYWRVMEAQRDTRGYVDYLGTLQRLRDAGDDPLDSPQRLGLASFLLDYPFADRLYPGALQAVARASKLGPVAVLSDGDVVLQPRKVLRSGLWEVVDGRVMIFVHKEESLDVVQRDYPARHYVMVDDKLRLLVAMKAVLGARLTTVFVKQGHYAADLKAMAALPAADYSIEKIGDLGALIDSKPGWPLSPR